MYTRSLFGLSALARCFRSVYENRDVHPIGCGWAGMSNCDLWVGCLNGVDDGKSSGYELMINNSLTLRY